MNVRHIKKRCKWEWVVLKYEKMDNIKWKINQKISYCNISNVSTWILFYAIKWVMEIFNKIEKLLGWKKMIIILNDKEKC